MRPDLWAFHKPIAMLAWSDPPYAPYETPRMTPRMQLSKIHAAPLGHREAV
jgi:hypothetical protein